MLYMVTVLIQRKTQTEPAGVLEVQVTAEIKASSWGEAVDRATEDVLEDHIKGGLVGSKIVSVLAIAQG